jgi:hypothetical protein
MNNDNFSAFSGQLVPHLDKIPIRNGRITTESLNEWMRLFKPKHLHIVDTQFLNLTQNKKKVSIDNRG